MTTKKFTFSTTNGNYIIKLEVSLKNDNVAVECQKGPVFSAFGGLWDIRKRDYDYYGQSFDFLKDEPFKNKSDKILFNEIYELWQRNHLNDMNAGTPEQERAIQAWKISNGGNYDYSLACEYLKSIGLYEVDIPDGNGGTKKYKYGHAWIYHAISEDDLKRIRKILED